MLLWIAKGSVLSAQPIQRLAISTGELKHGHLALVNRHGISRIRTVPPEPEGMAQLVQRRGLQRSRPKFR